MLRNESSCLKEGRLQLLLPLLCLLQDGFPSLVQVLQFALQAGGFFSGAGLHQFVSCLVHRLHCRLMSQNVNLKYLQKSKKKNKKVQNFGGS